MDDKQWGVFVDIIPLNDLFGHIRGEHCWCRPRRDEDGRVIHNAMDMREEQEDEDGTRARKRRS